MQERPRMWKGDWLCAYSPCLLSLGVSASFVLLFSSSSSLPTTSCVWSTCQNMKEEEVGRKEKQERRSRKGEAGKEKGKGKGKEKGKGKGKEKGKEAEEEVERRRERKKLKGVERRRDEEVEGGERRGRKKKKKRGGRRRTKEGGQFVNLVVFVDGGAIERRVARLTIALGFVCDFRGMFWAVAMTVPVSVSV